MTRDLMLVAMVTLVAMLVLVTPPAAARSRRPSPALLDQQIGAAIAAGRIAEAGALADSLIQLRERIPAPDPASRAGLLDSLALRFFQAGTPEAWAVAERLFRDALERRERGLGPDHPSVANGLSTIATVLDYQGRWAEALPLAERALAIRDRARGERHPETAASLRQVGLLHFQLGDYVTAGPPLVRSVEITSALGAGHEPSLADGLNNLGELARVRDRFEEAEGFFRRGLEVAQALGPDDPLRFALTNNLAGIYKDLGRYDDAAPLLERILALVEKAQGVDAEMIATAHLNLAEVYRLQGRSLEAAPHYAKALDQARRGLGPDHADLVTFLNQAAVSAQELGRATEAETLYAETRAIIERALGPTHPLLAQNQHDLAGLYLATGRRTDAEAAYRKALALREGSFGPNHPEVALTLVDLARERSVDGADSEGVERLLARAISILDSTRAYPETRLDAYALRAEWYSRQGRRREAIHDMATALEAVGTLRSRRGGGDATRAAFIARRLALFDRMLGWQLEEGQTDQALETHERARARVLLDQIAASGVDLRAGVPADVLAPLEAAEQAAETRLATTQRRLEAARGSATASARERLEMIAALEATRDSAAFDLEGARERIKDASPLWRGVLSNQGRIPSTRDLQRGLVPRASMMLVYHVGAERSFVFAVPPSGPASAWPLLLEPKDAAVLGVPPGALTTTVLERIVTGARTHERPDSALGVAELLSGSREGGGVVLRHRGGDGLDSLELRLHALWRALVPEPVWKRARSASTAIVVPDGALHLVPFEALIVQAPTIRQPAAYWLDRGPALAYGASASSLLSLSRRAARDTAAPDGSRILSVTDVAFARTGGSTWERLPGTLQETQAIQAAFAPSPVTVIQGETAGEPVVRRALAGRRYVHLATHGFVSESKSHLLAGLVLAASADSAPRPEDDGVLQLYEIYGLPLACRLAVLSACETHRGPRVAGEGAFALSRAFHAAGARAVVASLWAVKDEPAALQVGGLFQAIAQAEHRGQTPVTATALRDAKRRVRQDARWADPFYWAPFVLSGQ